VNSESVNIVSCAAGRCSHSFDATYNLLNGSFSVSIDNLSVAAENVVGIGAARTCTAQPISELTQDFNLILSPLPWGLASIVRYTIEPVDSICM